MAANKMTLEQRRELSALLHHLNSPSATPFEFMVKRSVLCFLNGKDAAAELEQMGVAAFVAKRAADRARMFIGNERAKRRMRAAEILEERKRGKTLEFTYENFRVTMDNSQHRNYGMVQTSIYSVVEVWQDDNEVEKEYLVNFSDFKTKEWLVRLLVWALMNQREVLIKPATQTEMTSMKMFVPRPIPA